MKTIYDCEIYPNYWIVSVRQIADDGTKKDSLLHIGDRAVATKIFSNKDSWFVGHNSLGYDDIMISCWLDGAKVGDLYALNQYLIVGEKPVGAVARWISNFVRTNEWSKFGQIRREHTLTWSALERRGWKDRKNIDTLILGEKQGSLKNAAIVLGIKDLREAPVQFGHKLTEEQMLEVDAYCWHDVDVTEVLVNHYKDTIGVRESFAQQGIGLAYVVGSAKLAELYLLKMHENTMHKANYDLWYDNAKKVQKSHRNWDPVADLLCDYNVSFKDPGFKRLFDKIKDCDLSYCPAVLLKGVDVALDDEEVDYEEWKKKAKEPSPFRRKDGQYLPKGDLLTTDSRGMQYTVGVGGLHNVAKRGVWWKRNGWTIYNVDVESYYPSLIIANKLGPRQFKQLCDYLAGLKAERVESKRSGNVVRNLALKLVLNATFGKTKDEKSVLFDPKCHFSVTMSGQMLLLMMIDLICSVIPDAEVINANTDGVCFYMREDTVHIAQALFSVWETIAKVKLEHEEYSSWAQASCNNYVAKKIGDSKPKAKGRDFKVYPTAMRETMSESPAVKKMVNDCLLHKKHPLETVKTLPLKDYMMSAGFGGKRTLMINGVADPSRRALRYAWSIDGDILQKLEKRGLSIVGEGRQCVVVDDVDLLEESNIDKQHYVTRAMMKVLEIVGDHTTLGLPAKVRKNILQYFNEWFEKE